MRAFYFWPVVAVLALAGCVSELRPVALPAEDAPADFPRAFYAAAAQREPVYRIDPASSWIAIHVYSGGTFARLGHDHVVASREVRGLALLPSDPAGARADVYFAVSRLTVDEPALRAQAGFTSELSAEDIENTRRRMLRVVLEADKYPFVQVRAASGRAGEPLTLDVALTLHGVTRKLAVPVALEVGRGRLRVSGEFAIRQTDFAIEPFSVLGGALAVKDELRVLFELHGSRIGD